MHNKKNHFYKLLITTAVIFSTFFLFACDGLTGGAEPSISDFKASGTDVKFGGSLNFTVTGRVEAGFVSSSMTDYDVTIEVCVDGEEAASVDVERVTPSTFEETLTVTFDEAGKHAVTAVVLNAAGVKTTFNDSITVTVAPEVLPTGITLDKSSMTIAYSGSGKINATVSPTDANDTVTWSSSYTSVATVSGGTVYAKSAGTTTITATTKNGKTATCSVTVSQPDGTSFEQAKKLNVNYSKISQYVTIGGYEDTYFYIDFSSSISKLNFAKSNTFSDYVSMQIFRENETSYTDKIELTEAGIYLTNSIPAGKYYIVLNHSNWTDKSGNIYVWR